MEVRDEDGEIVFLKRVREGPSSNSYGIHVARLAGLPAETLAYAEKMLEELNAGTAVMGSQVPQGGPPQGQKPTARPQRRLFSAEELIAREIMSLVPDRMTPLEALSAIADGKMSLQRKKQTDMHRGERSTAGILLDVLFPGDASFAKLAACPERTSCSGLRGVPRTALPDLGKRCARCGMPLLSESEACTRCRHTEYSFESNLAIFPHSGACSGAACQVQVRGEEQARLTFR